MKNFRVMVICSSDFSDIYFANQLIKRFNVVGVIVESQNQKDGVLQKILKAGKMMLSPLDLIQKIKNSSIIKYYYEKSKKIDLEQFGKEALDIFPDKNCSIIYAKGIGAVNRPENVDRITNFNPDVIVLCGCSIIGKQIIKIPGRGVINLHGGLSQRYRGVWTTLWAIYNGEPEYVGATVHFVDAGIDTGGIIYQGRPEIVENDNPETLYVKVVKLGVEMISKALKEIQAQTVQSYSLPIIGKLYLSQYVTPKVIKKSWKQIEKGVISKYLRKKDNRDQRVNELLAGKEFFKI